jgi:hypothetical protein
VPSREAGTINITNSVVLPETIYNNDLENSIPQRQFYYYVTE